MSFRTEVEQSKLQIMRAESRVLSQRAICKKLRFDTEPRYSEMASDLLAVMEARIDAMRRRHLELFGAEVSREQSEMIVVN